MSCSRLCRSPHRVIGSLAFCVFFLCVKAKEGAGKATNDGYIFLLWLLFFCAFVSASLSHFATDKWTEMASLVLTLLWCQLASSYRSCQQARFHRWSMCRLVRVTNTEICCAAAGSLALLDASLFDSIVDGRIFICIGKHQSIACLWLILPVIR